MSPEARASLRELTLDCIRDVQIATPYSRQRYTWAAEAWAALDEDGQRQALAARADAIERCWTENTGLRETVAKRWRGVENARIDSDDVESQCTEAFLRSMERFDVNGHTQFSTYVTTAMKWAIVKQNDDSQPFSQSTTVTRYQQTVNRAIASLTRAYAETPTVEDIALETGLPSRIVKMVLRIPVVIHDNPLDNQNDDYHDDTALDRIADDKMLASSAEADALRAIDGNPVIESVRDVVDTPLFAAVARQAYEAL